MVSRFRNKASPKGERVAEDLISGAREKVVRRESSKLGLMRHFSSDSLDLFQDIRLRDFQKALTLSPKHSRASEGMPKIRR